MPNKIIRKEYEKSLNKISLRMNNAEKAVLFKMMKEEEWENVAGFIKYKLFGHRVNIEYAKIKKNGTKEELQFVIATLVDCLSREMSYLNYRFNRELRLLTEKSKDFDEKTANKIVYRMSQYRESILERTESIAADLEEILKFLDIKIEKLKVEDVTKLPDSVINHALDDWEHTQTPEAMEAVRRAFEKHNRRMQEALRKRREEKQKNQDE